MATKPKAKATTSPFSSSSSASTGGAPEYGINGPLTSYNNSATSSAANPMDTVPSFSPLVDPAQVPGMWNMTTPQMMQQIYTGGDQTSQVDDNINQLIGAVADKLGIKAKKGVSTNELVLEALAKKYGIPFGGGTNAEDVQDLLTAVSGKFPSVVFNNQRSPWINIASDLGVTMTSPKTSKTTTTQARDIIKGLGNMSSTQIGNLQAQLWAAGLYPPDTESPGGGSTTDTSKIKQGNLDPDTMAAIGNLLNLTAQNTKAGGNLTWQQYLGEASASYFKDNNLDAQSAQVNELTGGGDAKITVATPDQLLSTMQSTFEAQLGRLPTQQELQQFTAQYGQQQVNHSAGESADEMSVLPTDFTETGVTLAPGVARPTYAETEYAQSNNTEYGAHQIANAGQLMMDVMRQNGQSSSANETQAG